MSESANNVASLEDRRRARMKGAPGGDIVLAATPDAQVPDYNPVSTGPIRFAQPDGTILLELCSSGEVLAYGELVEVNARLHRLLAAWLVYVTPRIVWFGTGAFTFTPGPGQPATDKLERGDDGVFRFKVGTRDFLVLSAERASMPMLGQVLPKGSAPHLVDAFKSWLRAATGLELEAATPAAG